VYPVEGTFNSEAVSHLFLSYFGASGYAVGYMIFIGKRRKAHEGISKSFQTGRLERELQMVQLCATMCSYIAILWVSLVSIGAITLRVTSQRVFVVVVYFIMTQSENFWIHPRTSLLTRITFRKLSPRRLRWKSQVNLKTKFRKTSNATNRTSTSFGVRSVNRHNAWRRRQWNEIYIL
jgi:hypothetical protein